MTKFTVIGLYDSSGQIFADYVDADDAHEAMRIVANNALTPGDLQILGAVQGGRHMYAACEDSGKAAYAVDLRD